MTQPTQAQIEAAKKLIYRFEHESMALHRIQRDWLVKEIAALTAAAQVGEPYDIAHIARTAAVITKAKQDTIERCAQVADNMGDKVIAAEIRKLKDAP